LRAGRPVAASKKLPPAQALLSLRGKLFTSNSRPDAVSVAVAME